MAAAGLSLFVVAPVKLRKHNLNPGLVGYYTVSSGKWVPAFWWSVVPLSLVSNGPV
jgi:hypothetical protein